MLAKFSSKNTKSDLFSEIKSNMIQNMLNQKINQMVTCNTSSFRTQKANIKSIFSFGMPSIISTLNSSAQMTKVERATECKSKSNVDLLAGIISGFCEVAIFQPLNVASTKIMVSSQKGVGYKSTLQKIYKYEGVRGLYKGSKVSLLSIPCYNGITFATFYSFQKYFAKRNDNKMTSAVNIKASICSGFLATMITTPLFLLRARIQANVVKSTGIIKPMINIVKNEGFLSLYKGFTGQMMGLSYPAIQMPFYEFIKNKFASMRQVKRVTATDAIVASMVSNITALAITYPHLIIRTQMMCNSGKSGIKHCLGNIIQREGIRGFYKGLGGSLVKIVPTNIVKCLTFELAKQALSSFSARKHSY